MMMKPTIRPLGTVTSLPSSMTTTQRIDCVKSGTETKSDNGGEDANCEKPTIKLTGDNFTEFKQQITGWMKALHPMVKKVVERLEKPEHRTIDETDIKARLIEEMRQQAEDKYNIKVQDVIELEQTRGI